MDWTSLEKLGNDVRGDQTTSLSGAVNVEWTDDDHIEPVGLGVGATENLGRELARAVR
jgi:hypothetical protein